MSVARIRSDPEDITRSRSLYRRTVRHLASSPVTLLAFVFIVVLLVLVAVAPLITIGPNEQNLQRSLLAPLWWPGTQERGGLLGTDQLGRDIFSRLLYGGRVSVFVSVAAVALSIGVGIPLGLLAGYREGLLSDLTMRIADAFLAIPALFVALTVIVILGPSLENLIVILAISRWVPFARVLRGDVLHLKRVEYIEAARGLGATTNRLLTRHILPNALNPMIVLASLSLAQVILAEAGLSFLGLGVPPPTPTWGGMLSEARSYLSLAPWIAIFPGSAITFTILALNILGDALRDLLDPRLQV